MALTHGNGWARFNVSNLAPSAQDKRIGSMKSLLKERMGTKKFTKFYANTSFDGDVLEGQLMDALNELQSPAEAEQQAKEIGGIAQWLPVYSTTLEIEECFTCTNMFRNIANARTAYLQARAENSLSRKRWARQNFFYFRAQLAAHFDERHGGG